MNLASSISTGVVAAKRAGGGAIDIGGPHGPAGGNNYAKRMRTVRRDPSHEKRQPLPEAYGAMPIMNPGTMPIVGRELLQVHRIHAMN